MKLLCRFFGHEASRSEMKLDPRTFDQFSRCRRCGGPLERTSGDRWRVSERGDDPV